MTSLTIRRYLIVQEIVIAELYLRLLEIIQLWWADLSIIASLRTILKSRSSIWIILPKILLTFHLNLWPLNSIRILHRNIIKTTSKISLLITEDRPLLLKIVGALSKIRFRELNHKEQSNKNKNLRKEDSLSQEPIII